MGSIGGALQFDRVVLSLGDGPEVFDNITYNVAVPEPATIAILGAGLVWLSGFRRSWSTLLPGDEGSHCWPCSRRISDIRLHVQSFRTCGKNSLA